MKRLSLLACALAFCASLLSSAPVSARSLVDLPQTSPLGKLIVDRAEDAVYYSLGNGRAIKYTLQQVESRFVGSLKETLLLLEAGRQADQKKQTIMRRNVRWRR